jgi:hypothetical protein
MRMLALKFEMVELELDEEELTMTIQELEEICAPICEKAIQILMRLMKNKEMDRLQLHNISKVGIIIKF